VATGGFGRGWLFPHSDIDLLFLHDGSDSESEFKDPIRRFSQELWDLRLKLSPATRNLAECERLDPNNVEFAISLLDCRYLAGDRELFRLHEKAVPRLVARDYQSLIQNLAEITRARHHKFGNTVFHLEPNVKDGPGGLRDYNVANWLALISAMEKLKVWPDAKTLLPVSSRQGVRRGAGFPDVGALFSAFPPRASRQHAHLGGAGRSGGEKDRRQHWQRTMRKSRMRPTGCASTLATCAACTASATNCWRKFRRLGRPCTGNFRAGGRRLQVMTFRWWMD
jgi:hypothetical protein